MGTQQHCATAFFYEKKKGNGLSTQEQEGQQVPISAASFFLAKQAGKQRWQRSHVRFSMANNAAPKSVTGTKQPCPGHAQHLRTVSAKSALHQAPLVRVRAPARLPPRFTSQFGHHDAFHGVRPGTPGSLFCSVPSAARVRVSLLLFGCGCCWACGWDGCPGCAEPGRIASRGGMD